MEALTWYGIGIGGSMSFNFLYDRFHSLECPVGYRHPTNFRPSWLPSLVWCYSSSLGDVNFAVLSLVSALPHGIYFIPALLSKTIRSLSLCRETGRGRLGCCVHLLQLWFCSHLSVIARDQPVGFVSRMESRLL